MNKIERRQASALEMLNSRRVFFGTPQGDAESIQDQLGAGLSSLGSDIRKTDAEAGQSFAGLDRIGRKGIHQVNQNSVGQQHEVQPADLQPAQVIVGHGGRSPIRAAQRLLKNRRLVWILFWIALAAIVVFGRLPGP